MTVEYISPLFKLSLEYSRHLGADKAYILSAKHGLLELHDEIEPYDITLNAMNKAEKKNWATMVLKKLQRHENINTTCLIFLAGENYRKYLSGGIKCFQVPMKGLSIGKQLQYLKYKLTHDNICHKIHKLFHAKVHHRFPFDCDKIPYNGIYVLFENGEKGHGKERIVRVGTHTGERQLRSRLKQHFINENKDRSIFRKNIGRALLNRNRDPFIEQWNWDLTTRSNKQKYKTFLDQKKQIEMEHQVTNYIQSNFTFIVFEVPIKDDRLRIESQIISTVSLCNDCHGSNEWLGKYSPKDKIRESGLWQVNELYKQPMCEEEFQNLESLFKDG